MDSATINGKPIFKIRLSLPRKGNWHADLSVDAEQAIAIGTPVQLLLGATDGDQVSFKGTVRRGNVELDTFVARVVGGAGGLGKKLAAQGYRNAPASLVLANILGSVGEIVAPSSDQQLLGRVLGHWSRHEMTAGRALANLVESFGGSTLWRVLADGTFFVGTDAFPVSQLGEFELLGRDPMMDVRFIDAAKPNVFPGETLVFDAENEPAGRQISVVEHLMDGDHSKTTLYLEHAT